MPPAKKLSKTAITLERSLVAVCEAADMDGCAFLHAWRAAACTVGEAFTAGKCCGGMMPLKIVLPIVRGFPPNGSCRLLHPARIIHLSNSCYRWIDGCRR